MSTRKDIKDAVHQILDGYRRKPIDFNVEISLQSRLSTLLKQELDPNTASVGETINSANRTLRPYVDVALNIDTISRVREEINTKATRGNLDLGVLQATDVTVEMEGTKRFREKELEAAIEIKYIKNADHFGDYRLQRDGEIIIETDLRRLSQFPGDTEKYFLLFSNADLFREVGSADFTGSLDRLKTEYGDVVVYYQHIPL